MNETQRRILDYLAKNPDEHFSLSSKDKHRLAMKLGKPTINPQTIGWVLWRLWKEGLIDSKKEGRKRIFYSKGSR